MMNKTFEENDDAFDKQFEAMRLSMLAEQYAEVCKTSGVIEFLADHTLDGVAETCFLFEPLQINAMRESGYMNEMVMLLDIFIQYRCRHQILPRQFGVVTLENGVMSIQWYRSRGEYEHAR